MIEKIIVNTLFQENLQNKKDKLKIHKNTAVAIIFQILAKIFIQNLQHKNKARKLQ